MANTEQNRGVLDHWATLRGVTGGYPTFLLEGGMGGGWKGSVFIVSMLCGSKPPGTLALGEPVPPLATKVNCIHVNTHKIKSKINNKCSKRGFIQVLKACTLSRPIDPKQCHRVACGSLADCLNTEPEL